MLEQTLQGIGITDQPPRWEQLTAGEVDVLDQISTVAPEFVGLLTEVVLDSWDDIEVPARSAVTERLAGRLSDIPDPVGYASATERLTMAALALGDGSAQALQDSLLSQIDAYARSGDDADATPGLDTRARFALGACTDLVCSDAVAPYRLQAALDAFAMALPLAIAAPAARAAGRLAEHRDDPLYERVLVAALPVPDAASDACLELGHAQLRAAARGGDVESRLAASRAFYRDAIAADESRPDAVAFLAAVDLATGFAAGASADELEGVAEGMHRAARELRLYTSDDTPSRALNQIGGWLAFASQVRSAAAALDLQDMLDLRGAVNALLDLYADTRTRVVGEAGDAIAALIRPRIEQWFAGSAVPRAALAQFADMLPEPSPMRDAAQRLLEVTVDDPGKPRRYRCRPVSPGGFALRAC